MSQLTFDDVFADNGFIKPCPYIDKCNTYNIGCQGLCYWCLRFEDKNFISDDLDND